MVVWGSLTLVNSLTESKLDHRRVLAVLAYLQSEPDA